MSLCIDDRLVCRFGWNCSSTQTCTLNGHLHRVTYTRCHIDTIDSTDDEHRGARNMYRIGINIYERRIVRQVGYLQELNRDARSTKHKTFVVKITVLLEIFYNEKDFCTQFAYKTVFYLRTSLTLR